MSPSSRRPRSPLAPIFLIVLVDVLSLTVMIPLLPFYAQAFGASPFIVGTLFASYSACQLVSGPILGNLSDRFGRRRMLLISQAGMVASLLVMAFAGHLWMLFVGRIISGSLAGNLTIAQAYITDHTKPEERTRAFGVIGIAFGLGFAIGPAMAAVLSAHPPDASQADAIAALARPLFLSAGLSTLSFTTTFFLLHDAPVSHADEAGAGPGPAGRRLGILEWRGYIAYFQRPELRGLLFQFFMFVIAFATFMSGFALFAERRFTWHGHPFGSDEVGYVYTYVGVLGIIIQGGMLRPLAKRYGDAPLVLAGFVCTTIGYFVLGLIASVGLLLVVAAITSVGNGFLRPALTARVTQAVARHEQGVVLGLTQSLQALAQVFAPLLGTFLIGQMQLFAWAAVATVVSAVGLMAAMAARRPPSARPDATLPADAPPG
ncbi:MAG: MFS transporter [Kofleriaceae bacterium]|nr:MFS transporter [Myxococcales bacterium]MCB9573447.1 MFS transporter [Kofleriaceae bacterium]